MNATNFWIEGHSSAMAFMLVGMQSETMCFPLTMFALAVGILLTFGLPIAFVGFIPAQILTSRIFEWWLAAGPPLAAAAAVALAIWVFRAGLRVYDSAGH